MFARLSEQDIEDLIETLPYNDDEHQANGYSKHASDDRCRQHRDMRLQFRHAIPPVCGRRVKSHPVRQSLRDGLHYSKNHKDYVYEDIAIFEGRYGDRGYGDRPTREASARLVYLYGDNDYEKSPKRDSDVRFEDKGHGYDERPTRDLCISIEDQCREHGYDERPTRESGDRFEDRSRDHVCDENLTRDTGVRFENPYSDQYYDDRPARDAGVRFEDPYRDHDYHKRSRCETGRRYETRPHSSFVTSERFCGRQKRRAVGGRAHDIDSCDVE